MDEIENHFTSRSAMHLYTRPSGESPALLQRLTSIHQVVIAKVSAKQLSTPERIFDSFSRQLVFPSYFGRNWEALRDCLCDLWWFANRPVVIMLEHADILPSLDPSLSWALQRALKYWNGHAEREQPDGEPSTFELILISPAEAIPSLLDRFGDWACTPGACPMSAELR